MLYIFRTILVHHQEQPFISCTLHLVHLVYAGTIQLAVVWLSGFDPRTVQLVVSRYTD